MIDQIEEHSSDSSSSTEENYDSESSRTKSTSDSSKSSSTSVDQYSRSSGLTKKEGWGNESTKIPYRIELCMLLFGTVILYNYNTFINGIDFFQTKFPDNNLISTNIARVHNIANAVTYLLSICFIEQFNIKVRFYVSILVELAITIFFLIYVNVGTPNLIVIYTVEGISAAFTAVLEGTALGLAGMFGGNSTAMAASGLALSGVMTAITRVLSKMMGPGEGWFFFGSTFLFYLASTITFVFFIKDEYVVEKLKNTVVSNNFLQRMSRFTKVMRKIWTIWVMAFVCMVITLALFPGYMCRTVSKHGLTIDWVVTLVISMFMAGDFLGRIVTRWFSFPSRKYLFIPHLLRLIFFVFVMISIEGVAIVDDIWIYCMSFLLAFTGGYYVTLCLNYTAQLDTLDVEEIELATFLISVALSLGVFSGSWLTYAMPTASLNR
ncbi:Nucleoside transporter family protein [Tritrichomonas foetus]|uniref:Nucleoside transporter family protein n=1 Tax=Tritrichomonas foetus TaxID=1144522 RepID=A0A1J4K9W0_9EUKA|nr:Nucleoside transporter family protein [Tritrichomonas foetus]|eukprot:OHT06237.1 Nucleoside transporter family protein [Tritrichomonas foetus]